MPRIRKRNILFAAAALGFWFLLHCFLIIVDGIHDEIEPAALIVILGTKVHRDGHPSHRLTLRVQRGFELYRDGYAAKVMVSGAFGVEGHDEALVMRRILIEAGVPKSAIVVDSEGVNTHASARNASVYLRRRKQDSVIVVSDYFHISRSKLAFRRFGIKRVSSSHAKIWIGKRDIYSVAREFFGYYAYFVRPYR